MFHSIEAEICKPLSSATANKGIGQIVRAVHQIPKKNKRLLSRHLDLLNQSGLRGLNTTNHRRQQLVTSGMRAILNSELPLYVDADDLLAAYGEGGTFYIACMSEDQSILIEEFIKSEFAFDVVREGECVYLGYSDGIYPPFEDFATVIRFYFGESFAGRYEADFEYGEYVGVTEF